jgi:hypothetical protein
VAEQHADYFDFGYLRDLIPAAGPERPQPGAPDRFLGFAPDFAYRYVRVTGITAAQAHDLGDHYGQRAARYAVASCGRSLPLDTSRSNRVARQHNDSDLRQYWDCSSPSPAFSSLSQGRPRCDE